MSDYQVRLKQQARSRKDADGRMKGQPGTVWYASVTHPNWIAGVDTIGASVLLHPSDAPDWLASKRLQLRNAVLAQAEANQLPIDGLSDALETAFAEMRP